MKYTFAQDVGGRGRYQVMLRLRSTLKPSRYSKRATLAAASLALLVAAGCAPKVPGPAVNGPVAAPAAAPVAAPPAGGASPAPAGAPYALPAPGVGTSAGGTQPRSGSIQRPTSDGTGNFRITCRFSHMNYDDSIIFPGQVGRAHMHTYFGNTGSTAGSTAQSLLTTGNSTCDGGISNRSSYWIPSMIGANNVAQVPTAVMVYYKSGYQGIEPGTGKERITLPNGLKLIAGDATATGPQNNVNWRCSNGGVSNSKVIPACAPGSILTGSVDFPQCWDGVNLDSPDHKSHVTWGQGGTGCPASHPVPLPAITYNVDWLVPAGGTTGWFLSSDMGQPGGTTYHGDIITAWDPAVSNQWLSNCTRQSADCSVGRVSDTEGLINAVS